MRVQNQILYKLMEEETLLERRIHRIDTKYERLIMNKLIPILRAYDIDILPNPVVSNPTEQIYRGFDKDYNQIDFIFSSMGEELNSEIHKRWSLYLKISYMSDIVDVGVIDIKSVDDLNRSFTLITQTLEDMGFSLRDDVPSSDESSSTEEEDPDIKTLIDFKNSLSESELVELEVSYE
jgi:hypothetical protein